jgi:hypothetical protein
VYNYKNNNEEYVEVIKSIENKVHDFLSNRKKLLNAAIISLIESMRNNPEKYSALVYHNNENQMEIAALIILLVYHRRTESRISIYD